MTSPSICQLRGLSVCQPKCGDTWNSVCLSVCPSPVLSIQPSAKFMVKMPTSIPVQNFLKQENMGKLFPSLHHQIHLSIHQAVHPSPGHHLLQSYQKSLVIMGRNMQ